MIIIGIITFFYGVMGYIISKEHDYTFEEKLEYLVDGTKPQGYDMIEFFDKYSILLMILGVVFVALGLYIRSRERKLRYYYEPTDIYTTVPGPVISVNPEQGSGSRWTCAQCGNANESASVFCGKCGTKRV